MATMVMVVFVNGGHCQQRRWWDGGAMMQWNWRQWVLWPMVAVAMAAVVLNCPAVVDAAATIPSLALTAATKMPLPLPPSTTASFGISCYCSN
jgi:hypothetical protein